MIAGVSWVWWVGFHAVVAALLLADSLLPGHRPRRDMRRLLRGLDGGAGAGRSRLRSLDRRDSGPAAALEWVGGYAIETSLSVDNLFVFLVIFQGFRISAKRQHKALLWGVARRGGAAGAVYCGRHRAAEALRLDHLDLRPFSALCSLEAGARRFGARRRFRSGFAKLQPAKGSLLPVILAIEVTDVLFAMDSIPAVLAISHNPFVVYTSNIAAVLGLRSLYFALAALLDRFRYLHYGLGAMLAFVALKMLAARWIEVPIMLSLAVMGAILAVCAVVSWISGNSLRRPYGTP